MKQKLHHKTDYMTLG